MKSRTAIAGRIIADYFISFLILVATMFILPESVFYMFAGFSGDNHGFIGMIISAFIATGCASAFFYLIRGQFQSSQITAMQVILTTVFALPTAIFWLNPILLLWMGALVNSPAFIGVVISVFLSPLTFSLVNYFTFRYYHKKGYALRSDRKPLGSKVMQVQNRTETGPDTASPAKGSIPPLKFETFSVLLADFFISVLILIFTMYLLPNGFSLVFILFGSFSSSASLIFCCLGASLFFYLFRGRFRKRRILLWQVFLTALLAIPSAFLWVDPFTMFWAGTFPIPLYIVGIVCTALTFVLVKLYSERYFIRRGFAPDKNPVLRS